MLNNLPTAQEVADEMMESDYANVHRIMFVLGIIFLAVLIAVTIAIFTDIDLDENNVIYDCKRGEIIYFIGNYPPVEVVRVSPENCELIKQRNK